MRIPIGLFGILFAATGCGDSSSPAASEEGDNPPPAGTVASVAIGDYAFSPGTLTIKAGTTVKWTNNGPSAHTTTSDNNVWNSPSLGAPGAGNPNDPYGGATPGGTYQFTFTTPGTYTYHCAIHPPADFPEFVGTITVTQ